LEDAGVMASQGARDLCAWLAIGWLFMVNKELQKKSDLSNAAVAITSTVAHAHRVLCSL
jgi:hypothetical protein